MKTCQLCHQPLHEHSSVRLDGTPMGTSAECKTRSCDLFEITLSLGEFPLSAAQVAAYSATVARVRARQTARVE